MANEKLSAEISVEEIDQLVASLGQAQKAIESLSNAASKSGLTQLQVSAEQAGAALHELANRVDFSNVREQIRGVNAELEALSKQGDSPSIEIGRGEISEDLDNSIRELTISIEGLHRELEKTPPRFDRIRESTSSVAGALNGLANVTKVLITSFGVFTALKGFGETILLIRKVTGAAAPPIQQMAKDIVGLGKEVVRVGPIIKGLGLAFGGLAVIVGVTELLKIFRSVLVATVGEFIKFEQSVLNLSIALATMRQFSSEAVRESTALAASMAQLTNNTDDAVLGVQTILVQVGALSGDRLAKATAAVLNFAAVFGQDLPTAALNFAKAAQGSFQSFSRFGFAIDSSLNSAEQFDALLVQMDRHTSTAELRTRSFGGQISALRLAWNDLLKTVGTSAQVFAPVIVGLTAITRQINELLGAEVSTAVDAERAIKRVVEALKPLEDFGARLQRAATLDPFRRQLELESLSLQKIVTEANFRREFPDRFRELEIAVKFAIQGAPEEEIIKLIEQLTILERRAAKIGEIDALAGFTRLREELLKGFQLRIVADDKDAATTIRALREEAAEAVSFELIPMLSESELKKRRAELAGLPAIPIDTKLDPAERVEFKKLRQEIELIPLDIETAKLNEVASSIKARLDDALAKARSTLDPKDILRATELTAILDSLAKRRQVSIDLQFDQQAAQTFFDDAVSRPLSDAQQEARVLGDLLLGILGRRPDVKPIEFIEADELARIGDAAELMRRLTVEIDTARQRATDPGAADLFDAGAIAANFRDIAAAAEELARTLPQPSQAEGLKEIARTARETAEAFEPLADAADDATAKIDESFQFLSSTLQTTFGVALDAMFGRVQSFADAVRSIFENLVRQIVAEFAKLAALRILGIATGGTSEAAGAAIRKKAIPTSPEPSPVPKPQPLGIEPRATEFARLSRLEASARIRERPLVVRVEAPRERFAAPIQTDITIKATDGVDVRRQLTSGALRREFERSLRRSRL